MTMPTPPFPTLVQTATSQVTADTNAEFAVAITPGNTLVFAGSMKVTRAIERVRLIARWNQAGGGQYAMYQLVALSGLTVGVQSFVAVLTNAEAFQPVNGSRLAMSSLEYNTAGQSDFTTPWLGDVSLIAYEFANMGDWEVMEDFGQLDTNGVLSFPFPTYGAMKTDIYPYWLFGFHGRGPGATTSVANDLTVTGPQVDNVGGTDVALAADRVIAQGATRVVAPGDPQRSYGWTVSPTTSDAAGCLVPFRYLGPYRTPIEVRRGSKRDGAEGTTQTGAVGGAVWTRVGGTKITRILEADPGSTLGDSTYLSCVGNIVDGFSSPPSGIYTTAFLEIAPPPSLRPRHLRDGTFPLVVEVRWQHSMIANGTGGASRTIYASLMPLSQAVEEFESGKGLGFTAPITTRYNILNGDADIAVKGAGIWHNTLCTPSILNYMAADAERLARTDKWAVRFATSNNLFSSTGAPFNFSISAVRVRHAVAPREGFGYAV